MRAAGPRRPARSITAEFALPVIWFGPDAIDVVGGFERAYGVGRDGAVLVRPPGFIAWRSCNAAADPERTLREVLARILDQRPA